MSACTIVFLLARTSSYIQIFIFWRLCEIMFSTVLLFDVSVCVCVYQFLPCVFVFFFFNKKVRVTILIRCETGSFSIEKS